MEKKCLITLSIKLIFPLWQSKQRKICSIFGCLWFGCFSILDLLFLTFTLSALQGITQQAFLKFSKSKSVQVSGVRCNRGSQWEALEFRGMAPWLCESIVWNGSCRQQHAIHYRLLVSAEDVFLPRPLQTPKSKECQSMYIWSMNSLLNTLSLDYSPHLIKHKHYKNNHDAD